MMEPREVAIRRNEVHRFRTDVTNRIKYARRDERMADNDFEKAKHHERVNELYRMRSTLDCRLVQLKQGSEGGGLARTR